MLSRTRIYDHVWDENYDGLSNTLEVHVMELRRKLEAHGPRLIQTLRGRGYRLDAAGEGEAHMTLAARLSAFFLGSLGLVLVAFSATLYVAAQVYLERQVAERLDAALDVLAAAAEVHPDSVEWEPQERVLPLGQEAGREHLRWMIFDDRGRRVDRSRNLDDADLTADWAPRPGEGGLPPRLIDRRGRAWQVARRRILPGRRGVGLAGPRRTA